VLLITTLTYPGVASKLVQYFNCQEVGGVKFLKADYSVMCGEGKHEDLAPLAIAMLVLVVVGFPAVLGGILVHRQRQAAAAEREEATRSLDDAPTAKPKSNRRSSAIVVDAGNIGLATGVTVEAESRFIGLTEDFADHAMYWEVTEMIRKLLLSLLPVILGASDAQQVVSAAIISLVFLEATQAVKPFASDNDQFCQCLGLFAPVLTLLMGMFTRTDVAAPGSESSGVLGAVLIAFNTVVLMLLALLSLFGVDNTMVQRLVQPIARLVGIKALD